jgi:DNA-directed RNA polymerase specialized sigma24 family protein
MGSKTINSEETAKFLMRDASNFLRSIENRYGLGDLDHDEVLGDYINKFYQQNKFDSSRASLSTFVYTSLRNHVLNYVRRRRLETVVLDPEVIPESFIRLEPNALESVLMRDFICSLSSEGMLTVAQLLYDGYTLSEICSYCGIRRSKLNKILFQIRKAYQKNI